MEVFSISLFVRTKSYEVISNNRSENVVVLIIIIIIIIKKSDSVLVKGRKL